MNFAIRKLEKVTIECPRENYPNTGTVIKNCLDSFIQNPKNKDKKF